MSPRCPRASNLDSRLRLVLATAVTAGAVACGDGRVGPATPVEAQTAATAQIREAATGAFPPGFTLEALPALPLNCTDSSDAPTGQVMVGVAFWVNGLPAGQNNAYFDALTSWWRGHGWTPHADDRPADMFLNATRDGFLMSLRANIAGRVSIGNTTPCTAEEAARGVAPIAAADTGGVNPTRNPAGCRRLAVAA